LARHRANDVGAAEAGYRRALALESDSAAAHYLAGSLAFGRGSPAVAEIRLRRSLALAPTAGEAQLLLARLKHDQGAFAQALVHYAAAARTIRYLAEPHLRSAVALLSLNRSEAAFRSVRVAAVLEPASERVCFALADVRRRQDDASGAVVGYRRALAVRADMTDARRFLGYSLALLGRSGAAVRALREALALEPSVGQPWFSLAEIERAREAHASAERGYARALAIEPQRLDALVHWANMLDELDRPARAERALRSALERDPRSIEAHSNLGALLLQQNDIDGATRHYRMVLALAPAHPLGHYNLGNADRQRLAVATALRQYRRAQAIDPGYSTAHWNEAVTQLMAGDYLPGWRKYEWRWRDRKTPLPAYAPWWVGEPLADRKIVILSEQGFGDIVHFARYAPMVAARGGRVVLECYPELRRLFESLDGDVDLIDTGSPPPAVDLQVNMMQLPLIFGTVPQSIPGPLRYLAAPRDGPKLPIRGSARLNVGLVWAGNRRIERFHKRSVGLAGFRRLLDVPDVAYYSLQVGPGAEELDELGLGNEILDLRPLIADFADTAALVDQLDLVIAVDTAVAHVAGALGRRLWLLINYVPDWRWLLGREDTPWYPSARLYRQAFSRDWGEVMDRVAADLRTAVQRQDRERPLGRPL
jgi:tetratricopeptide (TPR) repeat protein